MTAESDSMTLNEISYSALGVEERSDEAPRAGGGLGNQSGELFECKHFVLLVLVFPKQVPDGVLDIFAVTVLV